MLSIILLAVALSIDACIVAFSYSLTLNKNLIKNAFIFSFSSAFFQAFMPIVGFFIMYYFGLKFIELAKKIDHFIVFFIFLFLGIKIIKDAFKNETIQIEKNLSFKIVFSLSVATSLDALAAGVLIFSSKLDILDCIFIIFVITFVLCFVSFCIAKSIKLNIKLLQIISAIIIILIGFKILIEHTIKHI